METMEIDREAPSPGGEKQDSKPIVVILMGLPGSGKSTFCDHVMRISSRPWARICQDIIDNGKAGKKIQCLSSAVSALKEGKSVFIDRCNINREQRADFLSLGGPEVEKHAVVLDLPAKLCISRSVKRTGHEGNLQGGKAAAVVNQMATKKELPKLTEGFARITFCQDEKDVKEAIDLYGSLGRLDSLPFGCFGQKDTSAKTQLGIMKFFKKVDSSGNAGSQTIVLQKRNPIETPMEKNSGLEGTTNGSDPSGDSCEKMEEGDKVNTTSTFSITKSENNLEMPTDVTSENIPTLAFPSISTADFQFDLEKASDIIVETVQEFVNRIGKARLVMVDLSCGSKILSLVKRKAAEKNIDSNKFFTFVGDITCLHSQKGLLCNVIANAANWRLKPGGGGVNAAIFNAAGSELEIATKERATSLCTGEALVVPLPSSSSLFSREGVTHVIHVLGPNMNPKRPDCLKDDYFTGCKLLRQAYSSLFQGFVSIVKLNGVVSMDNNGDVQEVRHTNDDLKAKSEGINEYEKNKKYKRAPEDLKLVDRQMDEKTIQGKEERSNTKTWGGWAQALYNIARHPEKHKNVLLETLDDMVVINDVYPKAQHHLLVLARIDGLDSISDVRKEHISLLKTMHAIGLKWAKKFLDENNSLLFRLGYHSVPSMRQLHLHVMSQDFDSSHLKNKKHWNSFNTPFFLDSVDVLKELDEIGRVTVKDDKFLSMELRCHRCRSVHPNIPRLKSHISSCKAPFPAALLQNGRLVSFQGNTNY